MMVHHTPSPLTQIGFSIAAQSSAAVSSELESTSQGTTYAYNTKKKINWYHIFLDFGTFNFEDGSLATVQTVGYSFVFSFIIILIFILGAIRYRFYH
jgi:hypothetical protein